jgi:hypothetical protein
MRRRKHVPTRFAPFLFWAHPEPRPAGERPAGDPERVSARRSPGRRNVPLFRALALSGAAILSICVTSEAARASCRTGCCITTPLGNGVFNGSLDDPWECANLGGQITTLEACAAKAHNRLRVMPCPDF